MNYFIKNDSVVIITDNHRSEFSKINFSKQILDDIILNELNFNDLLKIWKELYGIPKNIKAILKKKIELYDKSSNVNSFFYNGKEYWLDKNNRTCLWNLSNSNLGDIEFILGNDVLNINSLKLKSFLLKLEGYAHKCYVNTFKHLKAVEDLNRLEDIINYDYTSGYPDKIVLE